MLIDFHTHAFPEKIAARAVASLSRASGGLEPQTDGTLRSLKEEMAKDGVDLAVVQSIATNPAQMSKVNNFAMEMDRDPLIVAFGSVHPDAPDALEELERIKAAGLKGVKFHPEYQQFYVDDEKMRPIYRKISELGLITLFHAGHDPGFAPPYHAMPEHLLRALRWFDSPVVAAHWGGVGCGEEVVEKLCCAPVWFDLAYGYASIARPIALKILEKHGPQRLLFGSDLPWHRPGWEMRLLDSLELDPRELEMICSGNARGLLGL
jgi:predicted TIM-barrel fold metal-dependent hydrolase